MRWIACGFFIFALCVSLALVDRAVLCGSCMFRVRAWRGCIACVAACVRARALCRHPYPVLLIEDSCRLRKEYPQIRRFLDESAPYYPDLIVRTTEHARGR